MVIMCGDVYKETYTDIKQLKSVVPVSQSILLEKNKVIRVVGPTRIEVTRGCIRVLGINVCASQSIYINRYRSYAIKAVTDSMIGLLIGEGGAIEYPSEGEEVIDLWENAAVDIIKEGKRIAVLGGVDSGKTSFSTLLSNIALEYNLKPAIIDADVGQCDLAPPGFIALKFMKSKTLWLREVRGDMVRFVGYTTPSNPIAM
ncbi:MAG: Clp1/GlmU family protein, partial [Ignisphaera sp.]